MAIQVHPSIHVHPGPWLKRQIVALHGINVKDLAAHFGVSRQNLSNVLNGHTGLTAEMAIRFENAFGLDADTLMRMQRVHDLAQAPHRNDAPRQGKDKGMQGCNPCPPEAHFFQSGRR